MTQVQGWHSGGRGQCLQNWDEGSDRPSLCEMSMDPMTPAEVARPQLLQETEWCQVTAGVWEDTPGVLRAGCQGAGWSPAGNLVLSLSGYPADECPHKDTALLFSQDTGQFRRKRRLLHYTGLSVL